MPHTTAETRQNPSGLPIDNLNSGVVLIDDIHSRLVRISRKGQRDNRALALPHYTICRWRVWSPRHFDVPDEPSTLIVDLYPGVIAVAYVDRAIPGFLSYSDVFHALRLPLAEEPALAIHHCDASVPPSHFSVGHVDISVLWIYVDACGREEPRRVRIQRSPADRPSEVSNTPFVPI